MFASNHNLKALDISDMAIAYLHPHAFVHLYYLHELKLIRNKLDSFTFVNMSNTQPGSLYFNANLLTTLSKEMREKLDLLALHYRLSVDLSRKPLKCDCGNVDVIEWLQRQSGVIHIMSLERNIGSDSVTTYFILSVDIDKLKIY